MTEALLLGIAEAAIQMGLEFAVKAIVNRCIRAGEPSSEILPDILERVRILERASLVTSRNILQLQAELHSVIENVEHNQTRLSQNVMFLNQLLDVSEIQWPWANMLLVLYNATRSHMIQNAKILLIEADESNSEEVIVAAIGFTRQNINETTDYIRQIAGFAKKATRERRFRCELDISANEDPFRRDSKLCSVLFELVITAFEDEVTRNMTYYLGEDAILEKPSSLRTFHIILEENDGFLQDVNNILSNLDGSERTPKSSKAAYFRAEKDLAETLEDITGTNDVYFLGLTGEGKSTLVNALMGEKCTRTSSVGVGTTQIQHYLLQHRQKTLRLWDLPGGDDANRMDAFNTEKLRCHLRNEQRVASVILVNQKGRGLRLSEQNCLLMYKELFGEDLKDIITVVIGKDTLDFIDGKPIDTARMRKNMVGHFENLGIAISPKQVIFIRPVGIGSEHSPPEGTKEKLVTLKNELANKKPVFTGFAFWMYRKLLEIADMRDEKKKSVLFEELSKENLKYVRHFLDGVNVNRKAKLVQKTDGLILYYTDFNAKAWLKKSKVYFRVDITGDNIGITTQIHSSWKRRTHGAVLVKAQLLRVFNDIRNAKNGNKNLVFIQTGQGVTKSEHGHVDWKEYMVVDPITGLSEYTEKRVRDIINSIKMKNMWIPEQKSIDRPTPRPEPDLYG